MIFIDKLELYKSQAKQCTVFDHDSGRGRQIMGGRNSKTHTPTPTPTTTLKPRIEIPSAAEIVRLRGEDDATHEAKLYDSYTSQVANDLIRNPHRDEIWLSTDLYSNNIHKRAVERIAKELQSKGFHVRTRDLHRRTVLTLSVDRSDEGPPRYQPTKTDGSNHNP